MKYKYLDDVKVTRDFYVGNVGIIVGCNERDRNVVYYEVELRDAIDSRNCCRNTTVTIEERYLEYLK